MNDNLNSISNRMSNLHVNKMTADNMSMFSELDSFRTINIINDVISELKTLIVKNQAGISSADIRGVIKMLEDCRNKSIIKDTSYLNDEIIQHDFYNRLLKDFPTLTICERRICILTILHLTTKEISDITRQSVDAINKVRIRLRKKLGLTGSKTTLLQFLDRYRVDSLSY